MIRELTTRQLTQKRGEGLVISTRARLQCARRQPGFGPLAVSIVLLCTLAGCGVQPASEAPALVPGSPSTLTTAIATTPEVTRVSGIGSPANDTTDSNVTLGAIADRINARWADLSRFREISTFSAGAARGIPASAVAASPASQRSGRSVREVILPDRARYVAEENGQLIFELVVIGEQVFARGTVASLLDPTAGPAEWIVTDITTVASNPMLGASAAGQLAGLAPPTYLVPERLRPQPVRELGSAEYNGTECALFGAADTTDTGARIDFTVAIGPDDRLCFIETRSIGISSRYVVEQLDPTAMIEPPTSFRPAASPVGSPTTNGTPVRLASPVPAP